MTEAPELISQLGISIVVFCSTNIDDIFLLAAFFSDPSIRPRNIVAGQFLGIGSLTGLSALAALTALAVPPGWTALLGLVPLALGARRLAGFLNKVSATTDEDGVQQAEHEAERMTHSQMLAVAGVTIANGGDNLGVYIPLFASQISAIPIYAVVFCFMTGLWCWLGWRLVRLPWLKERIHRYAPAVLPFVLIGLGIHILSGMHVLF